MYFSTPRAKIQVILEILFHFEGFKVGEEVLRSWKPSIHMWFVFEPGDLMFLWP